MKCPQCHYDYERREITEAHHNIECTCIEKLNKCIACLYEELLKADRPPFGQFVRDTRKRLEGK